MRMVPQAVRAVAPRGPDLDAVEHSGEGRPVRLAQDGRRAGGEGGARAGRDTVVAVGRHVVGQPQALILRVPTDLKHFGDSL